LETPGRYSVVQDINGNIFTWGDNSFFSIGNGSSETTHANAPTLISFPKKLDVTMIKGTFRTVFILGGIHISS
jgi:alpha-tubulin suppressor-like RCC1 family protein